ncbi:uncharacterized protein LOC135694601 isoform X1 [Rhopilema esculentum]|uniref:uncharacterized protein LOC135694601 isoform X1 n=1 Tax=Rhopilema esculentum TaxID=499914 RepID=UPI0031CE1395
MEETKLSGPSVSKSRLEEALKPYWEDGMTDLSSEEGKRIAAVALKENEWISRKQLKTWISNYKKKLSGKKQMKTKPSKINLKTRKRSAKDMFQEEYLRENKGKLTGIGCKWEKVKEDMTRKCKILL